MADQVPAGNTTANPAVDANSTPSTNGNQDALKTPEQKIQEKMFKVKINGKEEDWPESKVIERAQKSEAAEQMFKRAAGMEKALGNFATMVRTPEGALKILQNPNLGADLKGIVMHAVKSNPELLSEVKKLLLRREVIPNLPENQRIPLQQQAELEDLRAFKKAQEAERQAHITKQRTLARQQLIQKQLQQVGSQIAGALKSSGMPDNKMIVSRVARTMQISRQAGSPLTPAQAVERVKNDLRTEYHSQFANAADDESILRLLPEGVAERINRALLAKLKTKSSESKAGQNKKVSDKKDKSWARRLGRGNLL